jgi:hypothetical protein
VRIHLRRLVVLRGFLAVSFLSRIDLVDQWEVSRSALGVVGALGGWCWLVLVLVVWLELELVQEWVRVRVLDLVLVRLLLLLEYLQQSLLALLTLVCLVASNRLLYLGGDPASAPAVSRFLGILIHQILCYRYKSPSSQMYRITSNLDDLLGIPQIRTFSCAALAFGIDPSVRGHTLHIRILGISSLTAFSSRKSHTASFHHVHDLGTGSC